MPERPLVRVPNQHIQECGFLCNRLSASVLVLDRGVRITCFLSHVSPCGFPSHGTGIEGEDLPEDTTENFTIMVP